MVTDVGILMTAFMSPLKFEERTGTLVTVLLALFAFLNFARSMLPDVPVATWLDKQIFRSVAMSLIGMLETLLSKYEYVGFNLVDPSTLMQHDRYHPSQWDYDQPLSETQSISHRALPPSRYRAPAHAAHNGRDSVCAARLSQHACSQLSLSALRNEEEVDRF